MKKILCLAIALITVGSLFAQAEMNWGIQVVPNFSHRRLIAQENIERREINRLDSLEIGKFSYSAGAFVRWRGEKIGFQTGLNFISSGHRTIRGAVESGDPAPPNADEKRTVYEHYFIEAPAELQFFQELDDKNDFLFMMGLTFAYNIDNATRILFYNGESQGAVSEEVDNSLFTNIHYSFTTSVGWEHAFNESLALSLQPNLQFWLTPLFDNPDLLLNKNLYSVGLRVGLVFK
jgi:hypothetical protein